VGKRKVLPANLDRVPVLTQSCSPLGPDIFWRMFVYFTWKLCFIITHTICSMKLCTDRLPEDRTWPILPASQLFSNARANIGPRYSMGIGFAEGALYMLAFRRENLTMSSDLLVCVALGVDMVSYIWSDHLLTHTPFIELPGRLRISNSDGAIWSGFDI
jgi:hypothetical protein